MMNRDRLTRGSSYTNNQTRLGLPERVESALIYPLSLLLGLFVPVIGWVLAWLLGLGVFYLKKNCTVAKAWVAISVCFGSLSVLLAVVGLLKVFGRDPSTRLRGNFRSGFAWSGHLLGNDYSRRFLDSYGLDEARLSPAFDQ